MNEMSAIFDYHAKKARVYDQGALFGQLAENSDFKLDGWVWTKKGDGAERNNAAGDGVGWDCICGDQEVFIAPKA